GGRRALAKRNADAQAGVGVGIPAHRAFVAVVEAVNPGAEELALVADRLGAHDVDADRRVPRARAHLTSDRGALRVLAAVAFLEDVAHGGAGTGSGVTGVALVEDRGRV